MNIVYFFFEDDFLKWPNSGRLESFVRTNPGTQLIGVTFPVSLFTLLSNGRRFIRLIFRNKIKIQENIYCLTPLSLLPVALINRIPLLIKVHKFIFKIQINGYLKQINATDDRITWISSLKAFPVFCDVVSESRLLVFDCRDENTMKENTVIESSRRIEDELLKKADVVFALSKYIYNTRREKNKNCFRNPCGVDFKLFEKAALAETTIHEEIKAIPKPIVGYLGNIRSWLDFQLLEFLADQLPAVSFVFVGPVEEDTKHQAAHLQEHRNVYFLGRKDQKLVPGILKGFDICMIPFKNNAFNQATNPYKFWEYLATGKPILSLRLLDLEEFEDVVALYVTKEEAYTKLLALLKENDPVLRARRMEIAKNNDTSVRSKYYYDILVKFLNEKKSFPG